MGRGTDDGTRHDHGTVLRPDPPGHESGSATWQLPPGLCCVGFDLDDTLHYFKRASGRAAEAVFSDINRRFGVGLDDLGAAYQRILREAQRQYFSQARTSREYRAQRFRALLEEFGCDPAAHLDGLLDVYDAALCGALELRPGAREALTAARRADLMVMVVSEGPHDAQEATIERLGIAGSVDLLITSAGEGVSKSDGLFEKALARAGCEPRQMLYVGDSIHRDMEPAATLGIATAYVGDEDLSNGSPAVRLSLPTLAELLGQLTGDEAA